MPKGELNGLKEKKMSTFFFFLIFVLIIPGFIHSAPQYRLLRWKGDVKIRTAKGFIQPFKSAGGLLLRDCDAIFIPEAGEILIRFPGGTEKSFHGPRFTTVRTLENKAPKNPVNIIGKFLEIAGVTELFTREIENVPGTTKGDASRVYKQLKKLITKAGTVLRDRPINANEEKQLNRALALVGSHFDAFSFEEQFLMKTRILKYFNQHRKALMTVFKQYQVLRGQEQKEKERALLEDLIFCQLLPIDIHFSVSSPVVQDVSRKVSIAFRSSFQVWWAAFSYHGGKLEVIRKSYNHTREPLETFKISCDITSHPGTEPFYVFIAAFANAYESNTFDDINAARTVLLDESISESVPGTVSRGFCRVIIKIRLQGLVDGNEKGKGKKYCQERSHLH